MMILAYLLVLPFCVELAGWLVDATFLTDMLNEQGVATDEK